MGIVVIIDEDNAHLPTPYTICDNRHMFCSPPQTAGNASHTAPLDRIGINCGVHAPGEQRLHTFETQVVSIPDRKATVTSVMVPSSRRTRREPRASSLRRDKPVDPEHASSKRLDVSKIEASLLDDADHTW